MKGRVRAQVGGVASRDAAWGRGSRGVWIASGGVVS